MQDWPALAFYLTRLERFPSLRLVEQAADPGYYVIYARRDDAALIARLNDAIRQLYESGRLRELRHLERHPGTPAGGLGTRARQRRSRAQLGRHGSHTAADSALVASLGRDGGPGRVVDAAGDADRAVLRARSSVGFARAGRLRAKLVVVAIAAISTLYVEAKVARRWPSSCSWCLPPELGVRISEFQAGVSRAINYSAYEAEIFRLGPTPSREGRSKSRSRWECPRIGGAANHSAAGRGW